MLLVSAIMVIVLMLALLKLLRADKHALIVIFLVKVVLKMYSNAHNALMDLCDLETIV